MYKWIMVFGALSFICMIATIVAIVAELGIPTHKIGGTLTFTFACAHVGLIIYSRVKK